MIALVLAAAIDAIKKPVRGQDCELGVFGCQHHENHRQYEGWRTKTNGSRCSGADCRPARAWLEDDGWQVWIPEFRRRIYVPSYAVGDPERTGDGRSHLCISRPVVRLQVLQIFCFSPTGSKS